MSESFGDSSAVVAVVDFDSEAVVVVVESYHDFDCCYCCYC